MPLIFLPKTAIADIYIGIKTLFLDFIPFFVSSEY